MMRMGKNKHNSSKQQLLLEEYQNMPPVTIIRVKKEAAEPTITLDDNDADMGSLPGCIGYYNQPEPGFVCSTCKYQRLCRETTPTATVTVNKS